MSIKRLKRAGAEYRKTLRHPRTLQETREIIFEKAKGKWSILDLSWRRLFSFSFKIWRCTFQAELKR